MPAAQRHPPYKGVYIQSHCIAVPRGPSDGAFILGDRVRIKRFTVVGGRGAGATGVIVAINLVPGTYNSERPYQVLLDDEDCQGTFHRFGPDDLELIPAAPPEPGTAEGK